MFIRLALSLLWVGLAGFFAVSIVLHGVSNYKATFWLRIWLGLGAGFGIASFHYFVWRIMGEPSSKAYLISEFLVLLMLLGGYLYTVHPSIHLLKGLVRQNILKKPTLLGVIFSMVLAFSLFTYLSGFLGRPHGGWDAWMIWNLHARFLFRTSEYWQNLFSLLLPHPDYPLMIPANVARAWTIIGKETIYAPALISGVYSFSILGLLVAAGRLLRGQLWGYVAGLTMLTSAAFHFHAPTQSSDIPIALYFLAVMVLISLYDSSENSSHAYLTLSGFFTGFAIWTKNEGWLFLVSIIVARLIASFYLRVSIACLKREALAYFAGLIPLLGLILFHKVAFTPANDLVASLGAETLQKLMDSTRYMRIVKEYLFQIVVLNPRYSTPFALLPVLGLIFGFKGNPLRMKHVLTGLLVLFFVFSGYTLIFVTTPFELDWHLYTANARLFLQFWPMTIFIFLMMFSASRPPQQAL